MSFEFRDRYAWAIGTPGPPDYDYSYIEYYYKAYERFPDGSDMKPHTWNMILDAESARDFFAVSSLRQFNHLIQFDEKPNFEIKEPRWELYKISLTFPSTGENLLLFQLRYFL